MFRIDGTMVFDFAQYLVIGTFIIAYIHLVLRYRLGFLDALLVMFSLKNPPRNAHRFKIVVGVVLLIALGLFLLSNSTIGQAFAQGSNAANATSDSSINQEWLALIRDLLHVIWLVCVIAVGVGAVRYLYWSENLKEEIGGWPLLPAAVVTMRTRKVALNGIAEQYRANALRSGRLALVGLGTLIALLFIRLSVLAFLGVDISH